MSNKSNFKYILAFACLLFCTTFIYAKPKEEVPSWMEDIRNEYPLDDFIAQIGEGTSKVQAQNDAVARIANYFESNANTTTQSFLSMSEGASGVKKASAATVATTVSSNMKLFAVEYSEPYFNKKQKKYYVVGYIVRETVWNQYVPHVEMAKTTFYSFYDKALKEADPFLKCSYLEEAWEKGADFVVALEYARLLSPKRENAYDSDRETLAKIPSIITETLKNITFYVDVKNDNSNVISSAIKKELSKMNYKVSKSNDADYIVNAVVEYNEHKDDDLVVMNPVLTVIISGKARDLMNYEFTSEEVIAGSSSFAKGIAVEDLQKLIEEDFSNHMEKNDAQN